MKVKVVTALIFVLMIFNIIFYILWRNKSNAFSNKCKELATAEDTIKSLQLNNQKLNDYIVSKEQEIKKIQASYQERLNNIPADKCGDIKPSIELLKYLRSK